MFMGLSFENASAKLKTLKRNDINKCFDKINENVRVTGLLFGPALRVEPGIRVATFLKKKT